MRWQLVGAALLGAALLIPGVGAAQLYRWVDENGRLHVTDDLSRVPGSIRGRVELAGEQEEPRSPESLPNWNQIPAPGQPEPAAPSETAQDAEASAPATAKRHRIPVRRAGLELAVTALLDGRVQAQFLVDTGASINTIPRSVVDELGILIDEATPVTVVVGIGGEPMLVPVVELREVRLGDAAVERVEAAVLDTMSYGLLGMPFFNHFRVETDPVRGRLTLEEVDLASVEGVYGGYPEEYWRARFGMIRAQLSKIDAYRRRLPEEFGELHERVDAAERYWGDQYETLELRASREGVPRTWRE